MLKSICDIPDIQNNLWNLFSKKLNYFKGIWIHYYEIRIT